MRIKFRMGKEEGDFNSWWELVFLYEYPGRSEEVRKDKERIEFLYECLEYFKSQKEKEPMTPEQRRLLQEMIDTLSPENREKEMEKGIRAPQ